MGRPEKLAPAHLLGELGRGRVGHALAVPLPNLAQDRTDHRVSGRVHAERAEHLRCVRSVHLGLGNLAQAHLLQAVPPPGLGGLGLRLSLGLGQRLAQEPAENPGHNVDEKVFHFNSGSPNIGNGNNRCCYKERLF